MKFEQTSVSDKYQHWDKKGKDTNHFVEINTLEELLEYCKKEGHEIVISDYRLRPEVEPECEWSLETYDGYRE